MLKASRRRTATQVLTNRTEIIKRLLAAVSGSDLNPSILKPVFIGIVMSDTDNQDYYEGGSADAPLIDSLGSAVKRLLDKGKARGYITVEELNKALPSERESSEQIEDIMAEISDMGISIISESDVDSFEQENDEEEVYDDDESGNFDEKS